MGLSAGRNVSTRTSPSEGLIADKTNHREIIYDFKDRLIKLLQCR